MTVATALPRVDVLLGGAPTSACSLAMADCLFRDSLGVVMVVFVDVVVMVVGKLSGRVRVVPVMRGHIRGLEANSVRWMDMSMPMSVFECPRWS